ncbi:MAG: nucleotidyltransferase [Sphingobacteriales bacterium UTBCD1]|jgi:dTDP-glucose pyrophosphorylase|nr:MAG: nucleotidyltransferase [Sphingobacteriales bacterium UTBCD1]
MIQKDHTIEMDATVKDALNKLNELDIGSMTLFVIRDKEIVGTVTDGDIRRGLLKQVDLSDPVSSIMNRRFRFLSEENFKVEELKQLREKKILLLPVLNRQKELIDIIDLTEKRSWLPIDVLIMAGGEGKRLRPLTLKTPKPMLIVGKKPILEHNIDRLIQFGVKKFHISVKYLKEKIVNHFKEGTSKNIEIDYVIETKALGTIGALSLIEDLKHDYVLVMNADVLTNIDFEDMLLALEKEYADMIVASSPYEVKVPYGVLEMDERRITGLIEKPIYTYFSNAGVYIIRKDALRYLKRNEKINATDFMDILIANNRRVINYPILGYWLDIGSIESFEKAQDDIKHLDL